MLASASFKGQYCLLLQALKGNIACFCKLQRAILLASASLRGQYCLLLQAFKGNIACFCMQARAYSAEGNIACFCKPFASNSAKLQISAQGGLACSCKPFEAGGDPKYFFVVCRRFCIAALTCFRIVAIQNIDGLAAQLV